jgi:hypothetical protein
MSYTTSKRWVSLRAFFFKPEYLKTILNNAEIIQRQTFFQERIQFHREIKADRIPAACLSVQVATELEDFLVHLNDGHIHKKDSRNMHPSTHERKEWATKLRRLREFEEKLTA